MQNLRRKSEASNSSRVTLSAFNITYAVVREREERGNVHENTLKDRRDIVAEFLLIAYGE